MMNLLMSLMINPDCCDASADEFNDESNFESSTVLCGGSNRYSLDRFSTLLI